MPYPWKFRPHSGHIGAGARLDYIKSELMAPGEISFTSDPQLGKVQNLKLHPFFLALEWLIDLEMDDYSLWMSYGF